jgi:squalene-hopene/tetraprenyl-beta-curcumene cyclase
VIRRLLLSTALPLVVFAAATATLADAPDAPDDDASARAFEQAVDRAVRYLQTKGQALDGSYAPHLGPGVTAVVTTAVLRHGRTPDDPLVARSLEHLEGLVHPDGGIYQGDLFRNYETSLAILCFSEANRDGRYDKLIAGADRFIKRLQWDQDEGHDRGSESYGGAGYGTHKRPDLSNTSFLVEALIAAGNGPEDEAVKKALIFVSRCQNLESEHNTTKFSTKSPDGGFYYTCAAGGSSQAGETPGGGLRSYGSMTYAGLKSMIYAGVGSDDKRVKAALKWIQKHYGLESNPGMGEQGLYYYYHVFAKALDATGLDEIEDDQGKRHDWRRDLRRELIRRQRPDGSWINRNTRWYEGDPGLVTGYALLALSYCRPAVDADH